MPEYNEFVAALALADAQPQRAYEALAALVDQVVGAKLFTIMTADTTDKMSERVYSNMPEVYPVSGTKPYNDTIWSDITLKRRETFVANSIEEIAEVFDDHELIQSLGCESVINIPIVVAGEVIGTLNCLHEAGHYTKQRLQDAETLKLPGAICMLLHARSKQGDL